MRTAVLWIFVLLGTASCAPQVPVVQLSSPVRSVAVVPATPEKMALSAVGLTVFHNAQDVIEVPEWQLDKVAFQAVEEALSGRYQVVRANPDGACSHNDFPRTRCGIPSVPADLYVLLSDAQVGVHKSKHPFFVRHPTAYANARLSVFEAGSMRMLGTASLMKNRLTEDYEWRPQERIVGFDWHDYWYELSEAQQEQIRVRISNLLAEAVRDTTAKMLGAAN